VAGRLARRRRHAETKGLQETAQRCELSKQDAGIISSNKKSPRLTSARKIATAWGKARNTADVGSRIARDFAIFVEDVPLHQLKAESLRAMLTEWASRRYTRNTLALRYTVLRQLARHLIDCGAPHGLAKFPRTAAAKPREVVATQDELDRIIAAAPSVAQWMPCWVAIAAGHGLRFAEIKRLSAADYNADTKTITYIGKGRRVNTLPATLELQHLFDTAPASGEPRTPLIDRFARGEPTSNDAIRRRYAKLLKKAGANPNLHPHDLRRTLAERIYVKTGDIRLVQQALCHERLSTTATYLAHKDETKLRPLLEGLSRGKPSNHFVLPPSLAPYQN
jgi:integrase